MKVKVAAIQPRAYRWKEEYKNVELAIKYMDEATRLGAKLISFPEGYPGPCNGPLDFGGNLSFDPLEKICEKAKEHEAYVCISDLEENSEMENTYYLTLKLISPNGKILANYKRVQPDHQYLNAHLHGGRMHVVPGNEIEVVKTKIGNIGLQICSEIFVPEISRVQMLMGAEIILAPVNGHHAVTHFDWPNKIKTWQAIARARAAENLLYVVITQNLFLENQKGVGIIAGPEEALAQSTKQGIITATLDMERLEMLRSRYYDAELLSPVRDPEESLKIKCRPGQIHDRRPDLYRLLVEPQPDAFNYFYYKKGLDTWKEEFEKVKEWKKNAKPH